MVANSRNKIDLICSITMILFYQVHLYETLAKPLSVLFRHVKGEEEEEESSSF